MATDGLIGINSISFEISYKAQIPVHKHSSREHIIMHFLKRQAGEIQKLRRARLHIGKP